MSKKEIVIIADYTDEHPVSLDELRQLYKISDTFIHELIAYDIIQLKDQQAEQWLFDQMQLKRLRTALRLQHDLEVNLAGIALVLDLMDELEELRARSAFLEKHILK